jgi:hypothetical protein
MVIEKAYVRRVLIWLKHDIHMSEMLRQNPFGLSIYTEKNEGQEGKTGLFWGEGERTNGRA